MAKELGQATAPPVGPHVPVHKPSHGEAQSQGWCLHVNLHLPKRMAILVVPSSGLLLVLQIGVFFLLSYSWTLLFLRSTGEQLQQWENGKNNTNPAYSSWHWQPECCLVWQRAETLTGLIPKQVSTICTWTASKLSLLEILQKSWTPPSPSEHTCPFSVIWHLGWQALYFWYRFSCSSIIIQKRSDAARLKYVFPHW